MRKLRKRSETDQGSLKAFSCSCSCSCSCNCTCPVMTYYSTYYGSYQDNYYSYLEGADMSDWEYNWQK